MEKPSSCKTRRLICRKEKEMSTSKLIGPPVLQAEGRAVYKSCEIESGETVCIGDYVYMFPEDTNLDFLIARIESLFEADEAKCVQVRWLYRQTDLKHSPPSDPRENEVYYTNYFDCHLIQSIVGLCNVVTDCSTKSIGRKSQDNGTEVHICRFWYSEESGVFIDAFPEEIDNQNLPLDDHHKLADEDASADVKDLAHMLVQIERGMPPDMSTAQWRIRRKAWIHNVKAASNLEEVKAALLELEDGYHIFPNQTSWQGSIHAVESSDTLLQYIKGFSHEMQVKAGVFKNAKPEANSLNKLKPSHSYRKKHKRKRGPLLLVSSPMSDKQASQDSFLCKSIYEIEQRSLPPDAPQQLKNLRAALVNDTTKEYVTIAYPSMASLTEYFEKSSMSTASSSPGRLVTKCIFDQLATSTCTMPRFDEEFSMTHETAQRVLKGPITSTEYLQGGHLESFWLISGIDTPCRKEETQANKDENCCNAKEIVSSSPNQDAIKKHRPSEKNSPKVLKVYTHKKVWSRKMQNSMDTKEKISDNDSFSEHNEHDYNASIRKRQVATSLDNADYEDAQPSQHAVDSNPGYVFTVDHKVKSQSCDVSEENQCIVRWGVRKKITSRCRSNMFSDDSRNKGFFREEDVHKQHQHKVAETGHGSNAYKHVATPQTLAGIGKGKMLKVPKLMEGRWSTERYKAAQLKLFEIMKEKGAVPGKPLLRPALRVEARKHIGDTGLLDHLLKHMTDTVINDGKRFRRRHNSEGAMEYWLEDARLQELRRQAGVDQYWIPPPGWKIGDIITNNKNEGILSSQQTELKLLREEVEKLKSQLQYVCMHVGVRLLQSETPSVFNCKSNFQPWKKLVESVTVSQDIVSSCRIPPIKYDYLKGLYNGNQDSLTQKDSHSVPQPTCILQPSTAAEKFEKEKACAETYEMRKISLGQACDKGESKCGDEIAFFYRAAQRGSLGKQGEDHMKAKQGNSEKKSPASITLRRSRRSETTKETDNKENVVPMEHPGDGELTKAFQGWKTTQGTYQREALSTKSANVASELCKSPIPC